MRLLAILFVTLIATPLWAQTVDTKHGATFDAPKGWESKDPRKPSVALLRSKTSKEARIEIRVAPIKADKSSQYFATFHATLLNSGMKKLSEKGVKVSGVDAVETEYAVTKKGVEFRVVVVQIPKDDQSWLVVGMLPQKKRDTYYEGITSMISTLKFE